MTRVIAISGYRAGCVLTKAAAIAYNAGKQFRLYCAPDGLAAGAAIISK